jgi:hypothetical protein
MMADVPEAMSSKCSDDNGSGRTGFVSNSGSGMFFKTLGPAYSAFASGSKIIGPTRP